jgi:hypothetical protein
MESRLFRGHLELMLMLSVEERLATYTGSEELNGSFPLRSELARQCGAWVDDASEFILEAVMEDSGQATAVRDRLKAAWQTAQEHVKMMFATRNRPVGMTLAEACSVETTRTPAWWKR